MGVFGLPLDADDACSANGDAEACSLGLLQTRGVEKARRPQCTKSDLQDIYSIWNSVKGHPRLEVFLSTPLLSTFSTVKFRSLTSSRPDRRHFGTLSTVQQLTGRPAAHGQSCEGTSTLWAHSSSLLLDMPRAFPSSLTPAKPGAWFQV